MQDILITMRAARVNAGLTQEKASKMLGINADTLSRYEKDNSRIPRNIIAEIPKVYFIDSDNIFFGKETEFFRNLSKENSRENVET